MALYPKYIITQDNELIIQQVQYHKDIDRHPKGGGSYSKNGETIMLFGESYEFGRPNIDDIRDAIKSGKVYTNKYKSVKLDLDKYKFKITNEIGEISDVI